MVILKTRKKRAIRRIVFIAILVVILTTTAVFASQVIIEVQQERKIGETFAELTSEPYDKPEITDTAVETRISEWGKAGLVSMLEKNDYYTDEIASATSKYVDACIFYNLTSAENDYIMALVNKGYDFTKLIDIYIFIQNTNGDITLLREIYDAGLGGGYDFWIENAYERIKHGEVEALSLEEVAMYDGNGISVDDMLMAFELSLKGDMMTREILNQRLEGVEWGAIAGLACKEADGIFEGIDDLREINTAILYSKKVDMSISEAVSIVEGEVIISEPAWEVMERKNTSANELKNDYGVYDEDRLFESARSEMPKMDEQEIRNYLNKGMTIREIKVLSENKKEGR